MNGLYFHNNILWPFGSCKPKYCKVCCVTGSVLVFCAEFCPWMTDMKEVKEEEGLLEKEGFSFGPADKTDVEL